MMRSLATCCILVCTTIMAISKEDAVTLPAESWAATPTKNWPQIVLTNEAAFSNHTPLHGASAFLIKTGGGRIVAATAKHLICAAGGVKPDIQIAEFDKNIQSWELFPRTANSNAITAEKLACDGLDNKTQDWLILAVKLGVRGLPAQPLRMRRKPAEVGEILYLIGCPYSEPECKQNVYECSVTSRIFADRFIYNIKPPVNLAGFSGAPIVDKDGHVVGVMTVCFKPKKDGDAYLEGGGEDIGTVYDLVEGSR